MAGTGAKDLFPSIGSLANQTDKPAPGENENKGEQVVQEIKSLCMKCHMQVSKSVNVQ